MTNEPACGRAIAIIGSVGVPNRYGGPEAFAESISPELARRGYRVVVTCDRDRYLDDLSPRFGEVERRFIGVHANGAWSMLHDLMAFLRVYRDVNIVLALGVSGGLFFPLFRLLCWIRGGRLLVNIDGVEWRRDKFGAIAKAVLYVSDRLAQAFAHTIIYDNEGLLDFVTNPQKAVCVEYSGDHAVHGREQRSFDLAARRPYVLTVCRIEPENNCHVLIDGFLRSDRPRYVFVGNWDRSEYGRALRKRYRDEPRVELVDPVYDPDMLYTLRAGCEAYLHGHSVGGTNPSLVEILFFDCDLLCWDCVFNRSTAGEAARYFGSAADLAATLAQHPAAPADRRALRDRYSTSSIADKLESAIRRAGKPRHAS